MSPRSRRAVTASLAAASAVLRMASGFTQRSAPAPGFEGTANGEWRYYTGDIKGSRYSPLDQINAQMTTTSNQGRQ